jgi:hypothetical protein
MLLLGEPVAASRSRWLELLVASMASLTLTAAWTASAAASSGRPRNAHASVSGWRAALHVVKH